ncbi:MAG: hypothetical protein KJ737_17630 [Proteobacteria bacterium]|nr:hypothetical protein [Pseudomonadota bacterium]
MRWIEMINLRSGNQGERAKVIDLLKNMIPDHARYLVYIKWYIHGFIDTDLSIHLCWENKDFGKESPMGLQLIRVLENFGLVSHHIWVEDGVRKLNQ